MCFAKFLGFLMIGYVVITILAIMNVQSEVLMAVKHFLMVINWGAKFGFFEVAMTVSGVALLVI